mmetsp:Transcript_11076/g.21999  ORF Transcript_11076/g.21999 Transcript_11076/m.21999 type:complete len:299 (+) Transcript_11076:153-1049(+)
MPLLRLGHTAGESQGPREMRCGTYDLARKRSPGDSFLTLIHSEHFSLPSFLASIHCSKMERLRWFVLDLARAQAVPLANVRELVTQQVLLLQRRVRVLHRVVMMAPPPPQPGHLPDGHGVVHGVTRVPTFLAAAPVPAPVHAPVPSRSEPVGEGHRRRRHWPEGGELCLARLGVHRRGRGQRPRRRPHYEAVPLLLVVVGHLEGAELARAAPAGGRAPGRGDVHREALLALACAVPLDLAVLHVLSPEDEARARADGVAERAGEDLSVSSGGAVHLPDLGVVVLKPHNFVKSAVHEGR